MSGPRGHLGPGNRNRPPNPPPDCTRFVRPPTDRRAPPPVRRDRSPNPPGPYQVCATQPREYIRRTATLSHNEPPRPTAQLTTTLVSAGTSVAQLSPHHGPPAGLGVDGGGRSGRRPRRSGQPGPQPGSPAVRPPTGHTDRTAPVRNTPARKPPRKAPGNHGQQPQHSRGHRPSPNSSTGPNRQSHARRRLRRGGIRGVGGRQPIWTRSPGNTSSPARVLVLEVRRPRPLPRRLPGPCGALLLALWNDGADVPRLPLSATPDRPPPASRRDIQNSPERPAITERAPCPLCGHRRGQRRRHRR
jgi:hypothetical protein